MDEYNFDLKLDSNQINDWKKESRDFYNDNDDEILSDGSSGSGSGSGSFDDFMESDSDNERTDGRDTRHHQESKLEVRDGGDSPQFSDHDYDDNLDDYQYKSKQNHYHHSLQNNKLHLEIGSPKMSEERMDLDSKKQLSSSTSGLVQTRHDLETIRWSQDSAVKKAMADAELAEADEEETVRGKHGLKDSYSSGGALRGSTQSWNNNFQTTTLHENDDEYDEDNEVSSMPSSNISTPISAISHSHHHHANSHQKIDQNRTVSTYSEDNYEDDDDEFVEESPVLKPIELPSQVPPTLSLDTQNDGFHEKVDISDEDGGDYSDDDVSQSQLRMAPGSNDSQSCDELNKMTTFSSTIKISPPRPPNPSQPVPPKVGTLNALPIIAKFLRLGKREFEAWEEDDDGVVEKENFVMFLSEYQETFETQLQILSCVLYVQEHVLNSKPMSGDDDDDDELIGENLFKKFYDCIYDCFQGQVTYQNVEKFFLETTATIHGFIAPQTEPSNNSNEMSTVLVDSLPPFGPSMTSHPPIAPKEEEDEEVTAQSLLPPTAAALSPLPTLESAPPPTPATLTPPPPEISDPIPTMQREQVMIGGAMNDPTDSIKYDRATASRNNTDHDDSIRISQTMRDQMFREGFLAAQTSLLQTNAASFQTQPLPPPPESFSTSTNATANNITMPPELKSYFVKNNKEESSSLNLSELSLNQVSDLLFAIGFGHDYAKYFYINDIDGSLLSLVEKQEELSDLGINISTIKRKKLLQYILFFKNSNLIPLTLLEFGNKQKQLYDINHKTLVDNPGVGIGYRKGDKYEFIDRSRNNDDIKNDSKNDMKNNDSKIIKQKNTKSLINTNDILNNKENVQQPHSTTTSPPNYNFDDNSSTQSVPPPPSSSTVTPALNSLETDPTLPMARVYLKLLAEAQQETGMLKRRVWELTNEVISLKAKLKHDSTTSTDPTSETKKGGLRSSDETPFGAALGTEPMPSPIHPATMQQQPQNFSQSLPFCDGGGGGGGGLMTGEALAMQHAARHAKLRQQYDVLRSQLAATRRNADAYGRFASIGSYTTLNGVQREIDANAPKPLSIDEALKNADSILFNKSS